MSDTGGEEPKDGTDWLVVAIPGQWPERNGCFQLDIGTRYPGAAICPALAQKAAARGWVSFSWDVAEQALVRGVHPRSIRLISDMGFGLKTLTGRLAQARALYCLESPLQSKFFHLRVGTVSRRFDQAHLFDGLRRFSKARRTERIYFPIHDRVPAIAEVKFSERSTLVAICGNKTAFAWTGARHLGSLQALVRDGMYLALRPFHPIIGAADYYQVRRRVIEELAVRGKIEVFGRGWESSVVARSGVWRGANAWNEKLKTLARYRFCLCFENCGFPGYITEKIYDCFLAGVIPVYLGAPDVGQRFPPNSFVDFRQFSSPAALIAYLETFTDGETDAMLRAGRTVLESEEFARTCPHRLAEEMLSDL